MLVLPWDVATRLLALFRGVTDQKFPAWAKMTFVYVTNCAPTVPATQDSGKEIGKGLALSSSARDSTRLSIRGCQCKVFVGNDPRKVIFDSRSEWTTFAVRCHGMWLKLSQHRSVIENLLDVGVVPQALRTTAEGGRVLGVESANYGVRSDAVDRVAENILDDPCPFRNRDKTACLSVVA